MAKDACTSRAASRGRCTGSRATARRSRSPPISAWRAASRSARTERCLSATGRARSSASTSGAAFHLAIGPDAAVYVSAPTLAPYDSVYRLDPSGAVTTRYAGFGRPQGLAFGADGTLFVVEALAGASGLYRLPAGGAPELVLAGPGLVGVAFDAHGTLVVCSNDTAYRLPARHGERGS